MRARPALRRTGRPVPGRLHATPHPPALCRRPVRAISRSAPAQGRSAPATVRGLPVQDEAHPAPAAPSHGPDRAISRPALASVRPAAVQRRVRLALVRVALAAVTALLLGGCAVAVDGGSGGGSTSDNPLDGVNRTDLDDDEQGAVAATDAFWRETFPQTYRQSYRPARVLGGYVGEDGPSCGGQPSVPFNAFYCPSQDFLAWDENLMAAGYRQIGDAWVYLIIAHEWGHAIQARLRADQVSVAAELQADCFAGATLFGAADRGLLEFERGDIQELQETLVAVADDYPWTDQSDHGDARQRINAFNEGARGGPTACTS
jgi:predicted metalloprotease